MRTRWRSEADEWSLEGAKIIAPENLAAIQMVLEEKGPIILEHWFYRGSSAPDRLFFEDFEDFMEYVENKSWAGDLLYVWSFADVCKHEEPLAVGKCPDEHGFIPKGGAY
jgi:hypothetical protein